MPNQTFKLMHGNEAFSMPTDFNQRPYNEVLAVMVAAVKEHGLDPNQRYVAIGTYGDCVILDGGEVLLVSDAA